MHKLLSLTIFMVIGFRLICGSNHLLLDYEDIIGRLAELNPTRDVSDLTKTLKILEELVLESAKTRDMLISNGMIDSMHRVIDRYSEDATIIQESSRLVFMLVPEEEPYWNAEISVELLNLARNLLKASGRRASTVTNVLKAIDSLVNQQSMINFYDRELATQLLSYLDDQDKFVVYAASGALLSLIVQPRINGESDAAFIKDLLLPKLIGIVTSGADVALENTLKMLDGLIYTNCDHALPVVSDDKLMERLKELAQAKHEGNVHLGVKLPVKTQLGVQVAGTIKEKCKEIYSKHSADLDNITGQLLYNSNMSRDHSRMF